MPIKPRVIERIGTDGLLLDVDNPRLAEEAIGKSQDQLTEHLWRTQGVDELALSINANGYFPEEPLLIIPARGGRWTVVEGNRRLAAVRVLRSAELRRRLGFSEVVSEDRVRELSTLPASKYEGKKDLWQFFGFRHVNGPKEWDAYAKAVYVAKVFEDFGVPLDEIAKSIGDRHATVRRLYRGLKVLQQAEQVGFDRDDRVKTRFAFSHLYTGADYKEFQDYLGIDSEGSLRENPVPRERLPNLSNVVLWLYGSKSQDRAPLIRTQFPDLNTLRDLLGTREGRRALEAGLDLDKAVEATLPDERRFRDSLLRSKTELERAKSTVTTGYEGDGATYETGQAVYVLARSIHDEMRTIRDEAGEKQ